MKTQPRGAVPRRSARLRVAAKRRRYAWSVALMAGCAAPAAWRARLARGRAMRGELPSKKTLTCWTRGPCDSSNKGNPPFGVGAACFPAATGRDTGCIRPGRPPPAGAAGATRAGYGKTDTPLPPPARASSDTSSARVDDISCTGSNPAAIATTEMTTPAPRRPRDRRRISPGHTADESSWSAYSPGPRALRPPPTRQLPWAH